MRVIAITGTDTGVGKTVTTAALSRLALDRGSTVAVVKAVQTGVATGEPTDADTVTTLGGCAHVVELVRLDPPLAPDTAARRLGIAIPRVAELAGRVHAIAQDHDLVLLEGSGGIAVRLDTAGGTLLDLAAALFSASRAAVDFVVVTRVSLGTLNHTELTVDAVRRAGHAVAGVVLGDVPAAPGLAEQANLTELPRLTGLPVLGAIPHGAGQLTPDEFRTECPRWFPTPGWFDQR
jgi:dethiobiotin synthetase